MTKSQVVGTLSMSTSSSSITSASSQVYSQVAGMQNIPLVPRSKGLHLHSHNSDLFYLTKMTGMGLGPGIFAYCTLCWTFTLQLMWELNWTRYLVNGLASHSAPYLLGEITVSSMSNPLPILVAVWSVWSQSLSCSMDKPLHWTFIRKQYIIPVGCIPPTCQPYPVVSHVLGVVPTPQFHLGGGIYPWTYPPTTHPWKGPGTRDTHPPPVDRQTPVKFGAR